MTQAEELSWELETKIGVRTAGAGDVGIRTLHIRGTLQDEGPAPLENEAVGVWGKQKHGPESRHNLARAKYCGRIEPSGKPGRICKLDPAKLGLGQPGAVVAEE